MTAFPIPPPAASQDANSFRPWYLNVTRLAVVPWLLRLRAATALIDATLLLAVLALPQADIPLRVLLPLVALTGLANAGLAYRLWRAQATPRAVLTLALLLDVVLLTGLLDLTGGPFNPFAVAYAAQVALAFLTLGRSSAWAVTATAIGSYAVLLYWHTTEDVLVHHRINDFATHLFAMWVMMTALAEVVAYFVVQATNALEAMRARATRSERLVALTTLAAGAAHELSTPLGTIALVSRELERAMAMADAGSALAGDARLIRAEVDRCRNILDQMSGRAGGMAADDPEPLDIKAVVDDVCANLPVERRARVQVYADPPLPAVCASRAGLRQVLTSLVSNALDASDPSQPVLVTAMGLDASGMLRIIVRDRGPGMPADVRARAGEPFFTTKEAGRGMGLGLFLARVFAERNGGALTIESDHGTAVVLDLPLQNPRADA